MLMPAAVLIVLLLGAIAIDSAIVYLGQRQAYNVAFDAANDAAGAGFDPDVARRTGDIVYDPTRVEAIAADAIDAAGIHDLRLVATSIDDGVVSVTVEIEIDHLLVQAFGRDADEAIRMTARAGGQTRRP
ncbi:hypothetical protein [Actinospongicola halichondriae]|uniref:hypothetical protein n=1 Tax=Actinospongicola halichondriae TaxID=3236844 RepID=UPI003D4A6B33